jgi:hypothetical protein
MRLWDLQTKKLLRRFEGHRPLVTSVSFTAAGRQAAMDVAEAGGWTQVASARCGDSAGFA